MSDSSSKDRRPIAVMRWIARFVSIPWAYCALGLVWFVAGVGLEEGMPLALNITIVFMAKITIITKGFHFTTPYSLRM